MSNKNDDDDDKEEEEEDDEDDDDDDDVRNVVVRFASFTCETTRTHTHIHVRYPRTQAITTSVGGVARHCTVLCSSSTPQVRSQRLSVASPGTTLSCVPL